jgi:IS5 family transposase
VKSYKNINDPQRSFVSAYVEKHSKKNQFFPKVNKMIQWDSIDSELRKVYTKGLTERGAKAYSPMLLFKMYLISEWYGLSDTQTENMVYDSISALKFCGLTMEDAVPGHSTLSRFKKELNESGALKQLLSAVKEQLKQQGVRIRKGKARVDASLRKFQ